MAKRNSKNKELKIALEKMFLAVKKAPAVLPEIIVYTETSEKKKSIKKSSRAQLERAT